MSDMDKTAKAKAKATKAANEAKRKEAMNEIVAELRAKYPQLEQVELEKLAKNQMRRKALDRQDQMVLNPRVNSKADTKKKIIIGALVLTAAGKDHEVRQLARRLLSQAELKEADRKLFAEFFFPPDTPKPIQPQPQPQAPAAPRPMPTIPPHEQA